MLPYALCNLQCNTYTCIYQVKIASLEHKIINFHQRTQLFYLDRARTLYINQKKNCTSKKGEQLFRNMIHQIHKYQYIEYIQTKISYLSKNNKQNWYTIMYI